MHFSYAWIGFLPAICWIVGFFVLPLTSVFFVVLHGSYTVDPAHSAWQFTPIFRVLNSPYLLTVALRTIAMGIFCAAISLTLAILVGYYLAPLKRKDRSKIFFLVMNVFWTSFLVRIFGWKLLLHPEGALHSFLVFLHIIGENDMLLYTNTAILLTMVHVSLPFAILPIYSALDSFEFCLIEAASDLGAAPYQAFFRIFLPSIRKAILKATIMVFLPIMSSYAFSNLVGGASSELLGNKIVRLTLLERNFSEGFILALFTSALGLLFVSSLYLLFHDKRTTNKG